MPEACVIGQLRHSQAPDSEKYPAQEDVAELHFTDAREGGLSFASSTKPIEGEPMVVIGNGWFELGYASVSEQ
jgi:hypothetical protein